jgi:hypothetical protein
VPALPNVPKVLRISYKFTIGADNGALCRTFYQYTGPGATAVELNALATAIATSANTYLIPLMTADRSLIEINITDLTNPTAPVGDAGVSHVGTRVGGTLPASTAVLESSEILRRYRGGHPRVYWPFGSDDDLATSQTWTSGFVTAVLTALNNHQADWFGSAPVDLGSVNRVNVSYYKGFTVHTGVTGRARNVSTVNPLGPVVDAVVSEVVRQGMAQIRRRLLGLA